MRAAILTLFGVSLASALLGQFLPPGDQKGTGRYVQLLFSLVALLLLARPFANAIFSVGKEPERYMDEIVAKEGKEEYEAIFKEQVSVAAISQLGEKIAERLAQQYGVSAECFTVSVTPDEEGNLSHVAVFLSGKALLQDPDTIAQELTNLLGCEVEVR